MIDQLVPYEKYFYRAYAVNTEGLSLGGVESFSTQEGQWSAMDQYSTAEENNWWISPWLEAFVRTTPDGSAYRSWLFALDSPKNLYGCGRKILAGCGQSPASIPSYTVPPQVVGCFTWRFSAGYVV